MYPLNENYIEPIKKFISALNNIPDVKISTNDVSTQIRGEHSIIMPFISEEIINVFEESRAGFVLKIIKGKD